MKRSLLVTLLSLCVASCASAGRLTNTFNLPAFEAASTPTDSCGPSAINQVGNMTARRKWTGAAAGEDSLTNMVPGAAATMTATVPRGTYTVTVDVRDAAGNWSCASSVTSSVKGKPAKPGNLGLKWPLDHSQLMAMLESVSRWRRG